VCARARARVGVCASLINLYILLLYILYYIYYYYCMTSCHLMQISCNTMREYSLKESIEKSAYNRLTVVVFNISCMQLMGCDRYLNILLSCYRYDKTLHTSIETNHMHRGWYILLNVFRKMTWSKLQLMYACVS